MGDNLTRERPTSPLLAVARARKPMPETDDTAVQAAESGDDGDVLPSPGSPYDAAYARPSNKPEMTLHVLLKDGSSEGFAWSNYDGVSLKPSKEPGGGPVLVVRFTGLEPVELRIHGSNLFRLRSCIGRQLVAWIREFPNRGFDMAATDAPAEVITQIDILPFMPARQANGVSAAGHTK